MSLPKKNIACAALVVAAGFSVATVMANGEKKGPPPTTSTGRELTGPGAHHEEYIVRPADTTRPRIDTVYDRRPWIDEDGDTVRDRVRPRSAVPRGSAPSGVQSDKPPQPAPTPGTDDKSSTRPGE